MLNSPIFTKTGWSEWNPFKHLMFCVDRLMCGFIVARGGGRMRDGCPLFGTSECEEDTGEL